MLASVVFLLMAAGGYAGFTPWVVLLGVVAMADEGWWAKIRLLWKDPRSAWSTKVRAYFVTGVAANIALSMIAYAFGWAARLLLS